MAAMDAIDEGFNCPICLDLYLKPTLISCGHVFCEPCLQPYLHLASPKCPLCRTEFDPKKKTKAKEIDKKMSATKKSCIGCMKKMSVSKLRNHTTSCSKVPKEQSQEDAFPSSSSQDQARDIANRSTFQCPFCGVKNLDCADIIRHCNKEHSNNRAPVVCPICAVMPWGDPAYKSRDFIGHLNLRHKYEYDTFVDYQENEDEVLKKVLEKSVEEK